MWSCPAASPASSSRPKRELRPGIKVLLTSGYPGEALKRQANGIEFPMIAKPFRQPELADRLRQVLDGPAA